MLRILNSLALVLKKPLFGTTVIPRGAMVDPAQFPEEEYPVHCTKCQYCLNGLPDGRCPECGTEFDRGQLLVSTYVRGWRVGFLGNSTAWKWFWRFIIAGISTRFLGWLGLFLLNSFDKVNPPNQMLIRMLMVMMFIGPVFYFTAFAIAIKACPRGFRKRRRAIIEAIKPTSAREY